MTVPSSPLLLDNRTRQQCLFVPFLFDLPAEIKHVFIDLECVCICIDGTSFAKNKAKLLGQQLIAEQPHLRALLDFFIDVDIQLILKSTSHCGLAGKDQSISKSDMEQVQRTPCIYM